MGNHLTVFPTKPAFNFFIFQNVLPPMKCYCNWNRLKSVDAKSGMYVVCGRTLDPSYLIFTLTISCSVSICIVKLEEFTTFLFTKSFVYPIKLLAANISNDCPSMFHRSKWTTRCIFRHTQSKDVYGSWFLCCH